MSAYDFTVKTRKGEDYDLSALKGKVTLVVNTATGCGFTPQYEGLEKLYETYHDQGFEILDFPCNQFANQAPGNDDEIHQFCQMRFKTQFEQMAKIDVNGENEAAIFTYLKGAVSEEPLKGLKNKLAMKAISKISKTTKKDNDIKWNFTKFLVNKEGEPVRRYAPTVTPEEIEADIKNLLA